MQTAEGADPKAVEALAPCPFCGGEASPNTTEYSRSTVKEQEWGQNTFYGVNCIICGARTTTLVGCKTPELAAKAWNRRSLSTPNAGGEGGGALREAAQEAVDFLSNKDRKSGFGTVRMEGSDFYMEASALQRRLEAALAAQPAAQAEGVEGWSADFSAAPSDMTPVQLRDAQGYVWPSRWLSDQGSAGWRTPPHAWGAITWRPHPAPETYSEAALAGKADTGALSGGTSNASMGDLAGLNAPPGHPANSAARAACARIIDAGADAGLSGESDADRKYAERVQADLTQAAATVPIQLPNYADWAIHLPAGHWRQLAARASTASPPQVEALRPMSEALKDRTPILGKFAHPIPLPGRDDLRGWDGLWAVVRHPGLASDGFDMGWNMAAPVGSGGFPDDWFDGWLPLPTPEAKPGAGEAS